MLLVDLINAFNLINRAAFLKQVRLYFSQLYAWCENCYGNLCPQLCIET